jgi:hypothetical protein
MSPYIPYLLTLRWSPPATAAIWVTDDRPGALTSRTPSVRRAPAAPARLIRRLAHRRPDAAIVRPVASASSGPCRTHPGQSLTEVRPR